ncbi:MAG: STAS domain-containing protein [Planctomycetota bacterium]|nr:STAS domain-containing protein [Planctomycetota bacterium]
MNNIAPPEIMHERSVTIIRLGEDYANFYENLLENLASVEQLARTVTPPRVVVDMQCVKFIGSAFIGRMVSLHKIVTGRESGRFALCDLSSFCRIAIAATNLHELFEIFETADEAVQAFSSDLPE